MARRSVLISGAAAGIGAATARQFAAEGWFVGIYDLNLAGACELADELNALERAGRAGTERTGPVAIAGLLDVTQYTSWEDAVAEFVAAAGGQLDVLVNNAGVLTGGRFTEVEIDVHHATVAVNIGGVLNGCHAAYAALLATPGSHVINLCSASAIYGQPELASYSATKFAVRGLTEALELEWHRDGISVHSVWPLFVETAMTDGLAIGSANSLGIHLTPEEVASEIVALTRQRRWRNLVPHGVHTAVGLRAKVMATTANMVPSFLTRAVNRRISRG